MAGQFSLDLGEVADGRPFAAKFDGDPDGEEAAVSKVFKGCSDPGAIGIVSCGVLSQKLSTGRSTADEVVGVGCDWVR